MLSTRDLLLPRFVPRPGGRALPREGISTTGGYVYRGTALPQLAGQYVFGDFGSGHIWAVPAAGPYARVQIGQGNAISSFGEDAQGELYVVDLSGGKVSKLVATAAP